jgi:hypothetical protein
LLIYIERLRRVGVLLSMTGKDSDLVFISDLDGQLKEYKHKYEQAKTELRHVKGTLMSLAQFIGDLFILFYLFYLATSQLFLQAPKMQKDQKMLAQNIRYVPPHDFRIMGLLMIIVTSPTSKPKLNQSSTPFKASYPVFAPQHLPHRSTRTSCK